MAKLKLKYGTLVKFLNEECPKNKPVWGFVSDIPWSEDYDEGEEHGATVTVPTWQAGADCYVLESQILAVGGRFNEKTGKIS